MLVTDVSRITLIFRMESVLLGNLTLGGRDLPFSPVSQTWLPADSGFADAARTAECGPFTCS